MAFTTTKRLQDLTARLAEGDADAFVSSFAPNVRYLTGFTGSNGTVVASRGEAVLFTDPRYQIQATDESACPVKVVRGPIPVAVAAWIARRKARVLAFEANRLHYDAVERLNEAIPLGVSLRPAAGLVEHMRMVKSAEEVEAIRASVLCNSRAFSQGLKKIRAGMSESDLAAEFEFQMRRCGASQPAFETIVASGPRSALPHAQPGPRPVLSGSLLLVDMGCRRDGYCSDMTRMLYLGAPGRKVRQLHQAVLEAQLAATDRVREGVRAVDVDRAARKVLKQHGLEKLFTHSTGHGLGLEIHEPPRVGKSEPLRLEAGMALTIEPGIYMEGYGGIRIEDTVVVTRTGAEVLTPTPKELLQV